MQRRVRQKHSQVSIARRDLLGDSGRGLLGQQHNRTLHHAESFHGSVTELTKISGRVDRRHHNGKRLLDPSLPLPQQCDGGWIDGIRCQMKSAQALDGHHQPSLKSLGCFRDGVGDGNLLALPVPQFHLWAALPAGIRLSMKTSVQRIVVFCLAGCAHAEGSHRRVGPVVGNVAHNREARATVGAVDEGIQITPVVWIKQLPKTIGANADIRGNQGLYLLSASGGENAEFVIAAARDFSYLYVRYTRKGRCRKRQVQNKFLDDFGRAFDLNRHPCGRVGNISG